MRYDTLSGVKTTPWHKKKECIAKVTASGQMNCYEVSYCLLLLILPSCHLLAHIVSIIHSGRADSSMAMTRVVKHKEPGKPNKFSQVINIALLLWSVYSRTKTHRMSVISVIV